MRFTFNNKKRDKFPTATLKRLGLPPSPKALVLVDMNAPFQGTVGGRANLRGDRVFLRFNWREITDPADWDKAEADWGGGFVGVTRATVFKNWTQQWSNANMIHLGRIPPLPDEIPAGWSLVHDPMAGPEGRAWLTRPELPNPASGGVAHMRMLAPVGHSLPRALQTERFAVGGGGAMNRHARGGGEVAEEGRVQPTRRRRGCRPNLRNL